MAKYVVPSGAIIIKCESCKTLYVPEKKRFQGSYFVECCPFCGYERNSISNRIPLWKYNLIKFWRTKIMKTAEVEQE